MNKVNDEDLFLKAGKLVVFTEGEYSEYQILGHFVALEDVIKETVKPIVEQIVKEYDALADQPGPCFDPQEKFISTLIKKGLLVSVDVTERHLSAYDNLSIGD